jgi:hypothetical protein
VIERRPRAADHRFDLRRIGVLAAALGLVACTGGCTGTGQSVGHSCGLRDRSFIQAASIDVIALGSLPAEYQTGAPAKEIAQKAFDAAQRVAHVEPRDPSLYTAQRYFDAMFTEYGEAVTLQSEGKDGRERMYRAHLLATSAHDVLAEAQPELLERGCDVGPLL